MKNNYKNNKLEDNHNLSKGMVLFGPKGLKGFDRFYYALKDKLIQDFSFFPFGWGEIEKEEGVYDWSQIDELILKCKEENRKFAIAFWAAAHSYQQTPDYIHTKYGVRRITSSGAFVNFEDENKYRGFEIGKGAILTDNAISGSKSLLAKDEDALKYSIENMDLEYTQTVGFDFYPEVGAVINISISDDDENKEIIYEEKFTKKEKKSKVINIDKNLLVGGEKLIFSVTNKEIVIDNVSISALKPGEHGTFVYYPNYFDPAFKERYKAFIEALKAKYQDEDTLSGVYVGGYGRWDEVTLDADYLNSTEDPYMVDEQWVSYGYSDDNYLDHIRWCADLYEDLFAKTKKQIIMQCIAYRVPGDTAYINWSVLNYAYTKPFGIKTNGLTEKCTEFDEDANQFHWIANRYKHTKKLFFFEEAIQVNNNLSNIMGHPLSVFNRLIIDSIDYYWFYEIDIFDPYVRKYIHYANEQAGSSLVNQFYSLFGAYPYYSTNAKKNFRHYNIWMGIFVKNSNKLTYGKEEGIRYIETNDVANTIEISIDERQKWSGLFGSILSFDYYDSGEDEFYVAVMIEEENSIKGKRKVLGTVKKTDTNTWKTVSFYNCEYTNCQKSGGFDMPAEIIIEAKKGNKVRLRYMELNSVPFLDYKKTVVENNEPDKNKFVEIKEKPIKFKVNTNTHIDEIAVPIKQIDKKDVDVLMEVFYIDQKGKEVLLEKKSLFMPGEFCYLPVYLSLAPNNIYNYTVRLKSKNKKSAVFLDENGDISYRLRKFDLEKGKMNILSSNISKVISANKDFMGMYIEGEDEISITMIRHMPDGQKIEIDKKNIDLSANNEWYFKPQTSGFYSILIKGKKEKYNVRLMYAKRLDKPKKPFRYLVGDKKCGIFSNEEKPIWKIKKGIDKKESKDGIFKGEINEQNPIIETVKDISINTKKYNIFHLIMKNETRSALFKVFWKTKDEDYTPKNMCVIPTVANDSEYREYSFPIGEEENWEDTVTGIRIMPVSGYTDTGVISIHTIELRSKGRIVSKLRQRLEIDKLKNKFFVVE